jgi:hypothetical protein
VKGGRIVRTHSDDQTFLTEDPLSIAMTDIFAPFRTISSKRDAIELATLLVDPERERPAVVISSTRNGPSVDPAAVVDRLGPDADVFLLSTAGVAYDFEDAMPVDSSVYGGAVRSYPPGTEWCRTTGKAMVRLAYNASEGRAAVALIADDVAAMAPAPGRVRTAVQRVASPAAPSAVEGRVAMLLDPDGAMVKLDTGMARISTSALSPVPSSMLFTVGQTVTGTVTDGIMAVSGVNTAADGADHAAKGKTLPALVASEKAVILFPGLLVRHTSGEPAGAVVAVRVDLAGRADGKAWRLSNAPAGDPVDEALPFVKDGGPWISMPAVELAAAAPAEAAAEPAERPAVPVEPAPAVRPDDAFAALESVRTRLEHLTAENQRLDRELAALQRETRTDAPVPSPSMGGAELERLRAQVALMTRQKADMDDDLRTALADADDLAAENARLAHTVEGLREQIRIQQSRAARARQLSRDIAEVAEAGPLFTDPAEQFRHEVYLEWANRIPAGSKAETPLAEYDFAAGFLDATAGIQGVERSKIIAVAVEVLTGLADSMPGRDMHRLRGGLPGSPCVEHPELGTAWRVALQTKTASARRMHFWRGSDGRVVFATVGVHDDMSI